MEGMLLPVVNTVWPYFLPLKCRGKLTSKIIYIVFCSLFCRCLWVWGLVVLATTSGSYRAGVVGAPLQFEPTWTTAALPEMASCQEREREEWRKRYERERERQEVGQTGCLQTFWEYVALMSPILGGYKERHWPVKELTCIGAYLITR